jgi:hypothetical protein
LVRSVEGEGHVAISNKTVPVVVPKTLRLTVSRFDYLIQNIPISNLAAVPAYDSVNVIAQSLERV